MTDSELDRVNFPILVVEDDAEVRCLLEREIRDRGHPVDAAGDAEEALRCLKRGSYAVVVTDIKMPGMDGVELTRQVKARSPETEVVIITGYASLDSATEAIRLGAADYLQKPFGDIDRINSSVARALAKHVDAAHARRRLAALAVERWSLAAVLDRLPMGVFILDGRGQVILENRRARALREENDGLASGRDGLLLGQGLRGLTDIRRLVTGIGAGKDAPSGVGGAGSIERPSGRAPYAVLVTPLVLDGAAPAADPSTAIFVSDPERRVETAEQLLGRLYELTPSESRLAAILMQGKSVDAAARELDISTNTARVHLRRTFQKTGTARQGDLISLLLSGPALLREESS